MRILRDCLIFVLGGLVGSVSTYVVTKKKCQKHEDEALAEMDEYYRSKTELNEEFDKLKQEFREVVSFEQKPEPETKEGPAEKSLVRGEAEYVDYTSYYESDSPKEDEDYYKEAAKKPKSKGPKLIKREEFGQDRQEECHLIFYQGDGVLTLDEENEEALNDFNEIEDMIGGAITKYGFDKNNEEVIYVRNKERGCDYEIRKKFCCYYEEDDS